MTPMQTITVGLLLAAGLIGAWRIWRSQGRRHRLRMVGQILMAGLLYVLLYPPTIERPQVRATILTPGVSAQQIQDLDKSIPALALPGVRTADAWVEHVPDLASGLRRHPEIGDLRILGDGLPPRDQDLPATRGLAFEAGTEPAGLVDIQVPADASVGALWTLHGRVAGIDGAEVRLLDRSGALLAKAAPDDSGDFELQSQAKVAGEALYRLQLFARDEQMVEQMLIAVVIKAGDSVRSLILAGAPDAELKYLRRWIVDSGNTEASQISLSRGIEQRQNPIALSDASLAEIDLLICDDRAWALLSDSEKALIRSAVDKGMGLFLRLTGPIEKPVASDWSALGFRIEDSDIPRSVTLVSPGGEIPLTRQPLRISAVDSVPLAVATDGSLLGTWRAEGQGRVALWLPLDTYRLQLQGDSTRFGTLWSDVFRTMARARGIASTRMPLRPRIGQRSVFCGLDTGAEIEDADGQRHDLLVDARNGNCAAWWPARSGWQILVNGSTRSPFHVLGTDDAMTLARVEIRQATEGLVHQLSEPSNYREELPRWPLFLVWLLTSAFFWWLERRLSRQGNLIDQSASVSTVLLRAET
jgi:hypothetical protein